MVHVILPIRLHPNRAFSQCKSWLFFCCDQNRKRRLEINLVCVFLYAYYTILYGARYGASNYFTVFKHTCINSLFKKVHGTLAPQLVDLYLASKTAEKLFFFAYFRCVKCLSLIKFLSFGMDFQQLMYGMLKKIIRLKDSF